MSLNSSNTALLVVDVHRGLFSGPSTIHNERGLLDNIVGLIDEAHKAGVQIFYILNFNRALSGLGMPAVKLHPRITLRDGDVLLYKEQISAFKNTGLHEELRKRNIYKIVVTGLITQGAIKTTCLDGKQLGYEVVLVADGHSNNNQNAEEVINQWNENLRNENIIVLKRKEVHFI
ncbi:cysteine hydrolase family protein [Clostridium thermarum]|uniref:cysteine hydrolase family protein n=1 Tax=Clostridium thermarum TaxID=1716543 RepID=UPI00112267C5|nr:isochorismatase family cysteine hydrolase [Clostridium thermarum]